MYYEEKIINGRLHCRHMPKGDWVLLADKKMTIRLTKDKERIDKFYEQNAELLDVCRLFQASLTAEERSEEVANMQYELVTKAINNATKTQVA